MNPMKRILTTLSQKWPEYLLEMIVITAGILGAFALNNWNEQRKERIDEIQLLQNIRLDLQNAILELRRHNELRKRIIDATYVLYDAIDHPEQYEQRELDSLMTELWFIPTYNAQTGTINLLFTSGKITILQNEEIESSVIAWPQRVADFVEDELFANDFKKEIARISRRYIAIYEISGRIKFGTDTSRFSYSLVNDGSAGRRSAFKSDYKSLLTNIEFESLLADRGSSLKVGILGADKLIMESERIIELIVADLDQ